MNAFTKESLIAQNKAISTTEESKFSEQIAAATNEESANLILAADEAATKARDAFLTSVFKKEVSSLFSGRFTVYCADWEERTEVVEMTREMGFVNIRTYEPLAGDENNESIKDPRGNFAVEVCESESLIFGNHTEQFMNLFKTMIDVVKDSVIYTYAYNADYRLTFSDKIVAEILYASLELFIYKMKEEADAANKKIPKINVTIKKDNLDTWVVSISANIE